MEADGKPLDRGFYDLHMSGHSNAIIVPKILPHWKPEKQQVREITVIGSSCFSDGSWMSPSCR